MKTGQVFFLAALIGFGAAGSALADDVTFDASGTFDDGSSLGGSLIIDTATGIVQANGLDLTVTGGTNDVDLIFDTLNYAGEEDTSAGVNLWGSVDASDSSDPGASLELDILLGNATRSVSGID